MLLFDEADSLFGKRTEVKRLDTIATRTSRSTTCCSALETFDGIAILTTNLESVHRPGVPAAPHLPRALPVPRRGERERLWRKMLEATTRGRRHRLPRARQRFQLSGGYIRNAVLRAAFLAAEQGTARRRRCSSTRPSWCCATPEK